MRVNIQQNTNEWFKWRKTCDFTASEAAALLGESQFFPHNIAELKAVKTGVLPPPFYNSKMADGHEYEGRARELAENRFNDVILPTCFELNIDGYKLGASLDGVMNPFDETNIEIKVTDKHMDELIAQYMPQLQFQMWVSGISKSILVAYRKDSDTIETSDTITFDNEYVAKFQAAIDSYKDVVPAEPKVIEVDDQEVVAIADKYRSTKEQIDALKKELDEIKAELITLADGRSIKASGVTVYPIKPRTTIKWAEWAKKEGITPPDEFKTVGEMSWGVRI